MAPKLLVVDDEEDLQQLLRAMLERRGYEVLSAGGGLQAIRMLYHDRPDLVLLRVEDPDDWSLLPEIRARCRVPLILCSANESHADAVRGLRQGADDYVRWPSSTRELSARILARLRRAEWNASDKQSCL